MYNNIILPPRIFHRFIHTTALNKLNTNAGFQLVGDNRLNEVCCLKVSVEAGIQYESAFPSGTAQVIHGISFRSSTKFPTPFGLSKEIEKIGASLNCQLDRKWLHFAVSGKSSNFVELTDLLMEAIFQPNFSRDDIASMSHPVTSTDLSPTDWLEEAVWRASYSSNTLGLPFHRTAVELEKASQQEGITYEHVVNYLQANFKPERCLISGYGVPLSSLESSIKSAASSKLPPSWTNSDIDKNLSQTDRSHPIFAGVIRLLNVDITPALAAVCYPLSVPGNVPHAGVTSILKHVLLMRAKNGPFDCHVSSYGDATVLYISRALPETTPITRDNLVDFIDTQLSPVWRGLLEEKTCIATSELNEAKQALKGSLEPSMIDDVTLEHLHHFVHSVLQWSPAIGIVGKVSSDVQNEMLRSYPHLCSQLLSPLSDTLPLYNIYQFCA